ncbi:hypothetical protein SBRY_60204 [Actinacidiphila bryophytorum]|uniref:Uncharacterized protein n=1 Tax=Actinacidiphila bryophytorum TaxID=1436133 RepID=A0A9W4MK25_9ACTN|nr:hypothetical protein SBRY_60204 [Actinacidiphila bryophytorum]
MRLPHHHVPLPHTYSGPGASESWGPGSIS